MDNIFLRNKQLFILLAISFLLVVFVIVITIFSFLNAGPETDQRQPVIATPTPYKSLPQAVDSGRVSPIQKTAITKTTSEEVERFPDIIKKEELPNNRTRYTLESSFATRKNEIITQNGIVIFERILTPVKSTAPGFAEISEYTNLFGEPEEVIRGSHHYGPFIYTHIYGSQGLAIIGNTVTDEVFEIHQFTPMSVEEYIQQFGDDIDEDAPDKVH